MTAKEIPNMPAMVVKTMLSDKICCRMMGANSNGGDAHFQVSFGLAVGTCALLIALGMLAGILFHLEYICLIFNSSFNSQLSTSTHL